MPIGLKVSKFPAYVCTQWNGVRTRIGSLPQPNHPLPQPEINFIYDICIIQMKMYMDAVTRSFKLYNYSYTSLDNIIRHMNQC